MKKRVRLTAQQKVDIVTAYSEHLVTMVALAEKYGVTRQGIYKAIKAAGIDTGKNGGMVVSCSACGKEFRTQVVVSKTSEK